jgi:hypothetical protein
LSTLPVPSTAGAVTGEQVGKVQLLDDLQRNDPPGSFSKSGMGAGKWSTPTAYGQGAASRGGAYNSGGRLGYGSPGGWAGAYWNAQKLVDKGNGVAVKATLTAPLGNGEAMALWLNQPSPTTTVSGYELYIVGSASAYQGTAYLFKWTNGSQATLASSVALTQPGTTYALIEKNGEVTAWGDVGSGFLNPPGYLFKDASPFKEGYAGLQVYGTGPSLDNFSAGPLAPARPAVNSTSPTSPSSSTTPSIVGGAESGTTVHVYTNSACSGSPAASGSAASFASPGIAVTAGEKSTTNFYATATNSDGIASNCSNSSVTYVQDSVSPSPPTLSWTDPASPGKSTSPRIAGSAESGSTVKLYPNGTCTGSPLATGSAASFTAPGLSLTVAENSSTTIRATATDAAGNVSSCSSSSIAYVNDAEHILFEGAHIADFAEPIAKPGAISEVPDPLGSGRPVLMFTVHDDDIIGKDTPEEPGNPRAQLPSPTFIESGDEFWLRSKLLIPASFPSVPDWMTLVSVFGAPFDGTSPWRFEVNDDEFIYQRNNTYGSDIPWAAPLIKGSWVEVMLHERFGKEGWLEFWFNGTKVKFFGPESWNPGEHPETEKLEMATMDSSNDESPNSVRIGQYRKRHMFEVGSIHYQFIKVGTTRESVGG